jgi:hypothetical protein
MVALYQKLHSSTNHPSSAMTAHDAGKLEQWVENWKKGNLHQGILKYHDWQHYKMS